MKDGLLVFQRELDRSGGGRPGPRRLRGTAWAGAARPGQAPGAQGLQGSGDVARQPRFQACGRDDEGTPGAWSREGLVAARLHAKAAGQGQVGCKVLVSWAPGPVEGGSFPFVRKVAALVRQKRAPARAHLWPTPVPRLRACRPAKQPLGAGPRYAGPGAAAGAPAPRRQSSRPRSLFPFQLSANLPVKSSNYDDCPSAKSRENYKLLQNPPC